MTAREARADVFHGGGEGQKPLSGRFWGSGGGIGGPESAWASLRLATLAPARKTLA
jgi:hypothetical protein